LAAFIAVVPVQAQQGLTNTDIIKMQSAGLSESVILSSVNTQSAAYDTSTDRLLALKQAGVSDAVVAAMISRNAAMKSGVSNPAGTNLPNAAPSGPPPGVDEVRVYFQDKNKAWHPKTRRPRCQFASDLRHGATQYEARRQGRCDNDQLHRLRCEPHPNVPL
jgi:hypothetical protein